MGSKKHHSKRRKRRFYGNQSVGPKKLKVNTKGDNSYLRLRKLEESFEDVSLLDEESNDYNIIINFQTLKQFLCRFIYVQNLYQKTLNLEMIYHVAWVMLIKSTMFVETVVIKNTLLHQKKSQKGSKN